MTDFRSDNMKPNVNVEELIDEWMMLRSDTEAERDSVLGLFARDSVLGNDENIDDFQEGMKEKDETCENDEKEREEDSAEESDDDDSSDVTVNVNVKNNPECRRSDKMSSFYEYRHANAYRKQGKMRNRTRKQDRDAKNAYRRGFENGEDNYIY